MRPSLTADGLRWLQQFDDADRDAAVALLDSMRFVPGGETVTQVRAQIEALVNDKSLRKPAVLVPILSREDMVPLPGRTITDEPVAFQDFDPFQKLPSAPGSEAFIAHAIREIRRGLPRGLLAKKSGTLQDMRRAHVRSVVFVTDYIGSGRQVTEYARTWTRNPTFKSWRSFGWVDVRVVAYAATSAGARNVESSRDVDSVSFVEYAPSLESFRDLLSLPRVAEICKIYAARGGLKRPPLGYLGSAGMFASSFSVPNNLPAILIEQSSRWRPFFAGRTASAAQSLELEDYRPPVDLARELEAAGQARLAARLSEAQIPPHWQPYVAVLGQLPKADDKLASSLGVSVAEVAHILANLERWGLIDSSRRRTSAGKSALQAQRRAKRKVTAGLKSDPSVYYPRLQR